MVATVFKDDEKKYLEWIQKNEDSGYVLTTVRDIYPGYMSLHRASCKMISRYMKNMTYGAFTERKYIKICSPSISELAGWIYGNGGEGFTKLCSKCNPEIGQDQIIEKLTDKEFDTYLSGEEYSESGYPEELHSSGIVEGALRQVIVNAYERNPKARKKCIEHYGVKCSVCDFEFKKVYGEKLGSGFIHVHHILDIAQIGKEYEVDPINDLRPVCPNCHAMLHRHKPAMHPDELRKILSSPV